MLVERVEHRLRRLRMRPVVEGENNFARGKIERGGILIGAVARAAGRIDFEGTGDAKRVRIAGAIGYFRFGIAGQ